MSIGTRAYKWLCKQYGFILHQEAQHRWEDNPESKLARGISWLKHQHRRMAGRYGQEDTQYFDGLEKRMLLSGSDASISGSVWQDVNGDGLRGAGEDMLPGIFVQLHDDQGQVIDSVYTDTNGDYSFDVSLGDYQVSFTATDNDLFTLGNVGSDVTIDSDADSDGYTTILSAVSVGQTIANIDAGMYEPVTYQIDSDVRDFHSSHPDFQNGEFFDNGQVDVGLVSQSLGVDGLPDFAGTPGQFITSSATFDQWYTDVLDVNVLVNVPLDFVETGVQTGVYQFEDYSFFPLNNDGFGIESPNVNNQHFTLHTSAKFIYDPGQFVSISADDDAWLYIDGQLAVDLGGLHPARSGSVDLDTLGLVAGQEYEFDLFFAERLTSNSALDIQTNITLYQGDYVPPVQSVSGTVWEDYDGDGTRDASEPGMDGVSVFLDANSNATLDAGELSTTTDANGNYEFTDVPIGTYDIYQQTPTGWVQTYPQATDGALLDADHSTEMVNELTSNYHSYRPVANGDGTIIAFSSVASTLVTGDTNGVMDIFVTNMTTGTTVRVSVASDGTQANGASDLSSISDDGRYIAFESEASNLVAGDTNGAKDIFVYDLQTSTIQRVSVASNGTQADGLSKDVMISGDGRYVTFTSSATNLVAGDTNSSDDIFVYDMQTSTIERVSVDSSGTQANGSSSRSTITDDGRYVAYESTASNLIASDANGGTQDAFLYDRQTGQTTIVNIGENGQQGSGAYVPVISGDGSTIAFVSGNALLNADANAEWDIYTKDLQTGELMIPSLTVGYGSNGIERLSDDGRYLVWAAYDSQLVSGDTNSAWDILVWDRETGEIQLISDGLNGEQSNNGNWNPAISDDASVVVYSSRASNLVDGDSGNNRFDIFATSFDVQPGGAGSHNIELTSGNQETGLLFGNQPLAYVSGGSIINEGDSFTLNLNQTDTENNAVTQWDIDWGDGSAVQTVSGATTSLSHTFTDGDQVHQIQVTATTANGSWQVTPHTLYVTNVAPSITVNSAAVVIDEGQTATNTGTFSDPGDDTVTLAASVGTVIDNGDGTWSWSFDSTDDPDETQTVTITATDSDGAETQTTFSLTVNNIAPSILVDTASVTVNEGDTASNSGTYINIGDDTVSLSASVGTVIDNGDGTWSWSFDSTDGTAQSQTVTITATDSDGDVSSVAFALTVNNVAPTITASNTDVTIDESQTATNTGSFADVGTEALVLSATIGTVIDNGNGTWSWSFDSTDGPSESQVVTITVTDSDGATDTVDFNLTVNNVAPTITVDNSSVVFNEGDTATNTGTFSDPGIETLTLTASVGTIIDNGDGTWSWSFEPSDGPDDSQVVTITVTDSDGAFDTVTFDLTVNNVAPTLLADSNQVTINESETAVNTGVFADAGDDTVTLVASVGTIIDNGDGTWSWSFDSADGPDESQTVTITATDSDGSQTSIDFDLIVNNVAPSIAADSASIIINESETATNTGTFGDLGNDTMTLAASVGTVIDNGDGTWSWSFDSNDGPDQTQVVTITATDSDGAQSSVDFNLTVNNVAPILAVTGAAVVINESEIATNSGTFSDVGDDTIVLTASVGTVIDNGDGTWSWSFDSTDGPDDTQVVTITATDSDGAATDVTFDLTVNNVAPTIAADNASITIDESDMATNTGTFGDVGDDTMTLTASIGTVIDNGDGTWSWSFDSTDGPDDTQVVTITATDSDGAATDVTFDLTVNNVAPTIAADNALVTINESQTATNTGTFGDVGDDTMTLSASVGTVIDNGDGTWSWSFDSTDGPAQTQVVSITATDSDGAQTVVNFNLTVNNVAPSITVDQAQVTVNESETAINSGTFSDPGADILDLSASIGSVIDNGDGTWSWSFDATDGPAQSQVVTVTVTDSDGAATNVTFDLTVNNIAPTITIDAMSITYDQRELAINTGTFGDLGSDVLTLTTTLGNVYDNGDGTWRWEYDTTNFAATNQSVTVTVTDHDGASDSVVFGLNIVPTSLMDVDQQTVTVDEGSTVTNSGILIDLDVDASAVLSASVGTVIDNGDGTWSWSFDSTDGPDESQQVTITAEITGNPYAMGNSLNPVINEGGDVVVFENGWHKFVYGDNNWLSDIFAYDVATGNIRRISVRTDGGEGDGASTDATVSNDGRYIVYQSDATNLVDGDTNASTDIFWYDMLTQQTRRISVASDGTQADGASFDAQISGNGRYVTFTSDATNLVAGDTNGVADIFVYDLQTSTIQRVSVDSAGIQANAASEYSSISDDGRYVVYGSYASNLDVLDTNDLADAFLHDTVTGHTEAVSLTTMTRYNLATAPVISGDGSKIAFTAGYSLIPEDVDIEWDYYIYDVNTGTYQTPDPVNPNIYVYDVVFSNDGQYMFFTGMDSFTPDDTNGYWDIFQYDIANDQITRLTHQADGSDLVNHAMMPDYDVLSNLLVLSTRSTGLVPNDINGKIDVFIQDLTNDTFTQIKKADINYTSTVTFNLTVNNVAPTIAADSALVVINESQTATNTGTFGDVGVDDLTLAASIGTVIDNGDGTWSWSFDSTDGPDESQTVTITATDSDGAATDVTFNLTVNNVAPTIAADSALVVINESQTATNTGTFGDVGVDDLTLAASIGTVIDNGDGTWSWSFDSTDGPDESQTVTITATDSDGAATDVTFDLTVNNVAPTIAADSALVVINESQTATNTGTFGDVGDDTMTLTASIGTVIDNGDGTWSWSFDSTDGPDESQTVTITATDSDGAATDVTFDLTVNNVAPTIAADSALVVINESQTATNTGTFGDVGVDDLTLAASIGTVIDNGDGTWSWSFDSTDGPDESQTVTITATDSDGAATDVTFNLTVNNVAPTIAADSALVVINESQTATNTGTFGDVGVDDLTLAASIGTVIDNGDGTWSWSFDSTDGPDESQTVTITATDSDGAATDVTFDLTVNNVAPTIAADSALVVINESQTATNTGTFGDVGVDDLTLAASIGTVIDNGDGTWSWSFDSTDGPDESQTVTITATDSDGAATDVTFDLTVNNVAPTIAADSALVVINESQTATNTGTFGDVGVDDLTLAASIGTVIDNGDGTWSWSFDSTDGPDESQTVTITATDSDGAATDVTFDLTVNNVAPTIAADSALVVINESQTATNTGTFGDVGVDDLTLAASIGTVIDNGDGTWSWSFDSTDGPDESQTVTITATDSDGAATDVTFNLTVNNVAPTIAADSALVVINESQTATNTGTFGDVGVDDLTLAASIGTVIDNGDGTWSWSFDSTDGPDESQTVTITATDSDGAATDVTFDLTVNNVAPTIAADSALVVINESQTATNTGTFGDVGVDDLTLAASIGTVIDNGDGTWSWSFDSTDGPDESQTVTITATDSDGAATDVTFDLTVNNVAPTIAADSALVVINESQTATNTGTFGDVGVDDLTLAASIGTVIDNGDGTWSWSFDSTDGPDESQTVTITATDSDGAATDVTFNLTVNNVAPTIAADSALVVINESQTATNTGTFGDVGVDDLTLAASIGTVIDNGDGTWSWSFDSTDGPDESQTVTITATDSDGAATDVTFDLTVNNVAPTIVLTGDSSVNVNVQYTLTIEVSDPGVETITQMVVDWGDGTTPQQITVGQTTATHAFTETGNYQVQVSVTDEDGVWYSNTLDVEALGITIVENSDFEVVHEEAVVLAAGTQSLSINVLDFLFDESDIAAPNDAFEIAFVDENGNSLVGTIAQGRDAFFNISEGQDALIGGGVLYDPATGHIDLDVSHLSEGITGTVVFRLVNNDQDTTTQVTIDPTVVQSATSPVVNPTTATGNIASYTSEQTIDWDRLTDITNAFDIDYTQSSYNTDTGRWFAGLTLTNNTSYAINETLVLGVRAISDSSVSAIGDGQTAEGMVWYDLSSYVENGVVQLGDVIDQIVLTFDNPDSVQFDYELVVYGLMNQAPTFTSTPVDEVVAGQTYSYQLTATDPEGDALTYELVSYPDGMSFDDQTNTITWTTSSTDVGTQPVFARVTDAYGASDIQIFAIDVVEGVANRPPVFTSTPVVDAYIGEDAVYLYQSTAVDPDGNTLTYTVVDGPDGLGILDSSTGLVTWENVSADLVNQLVDVTLQVSDGNGGVAEQVYQILVHEDPENNGPVFVSVPETHYGIVTTGDSSGEVVPSQIDMNLGYQDTHQHTVEITLGTSGTDIGDNFIPPTGPLDAMTVTNEIDAGVLANILTLGGGAGLLVTNSNLLVNTSYNTGQLEASGAGVYVNNNNTYGMSDYGVVLTSGNAADYGSGANTVSDYQWAYFESDGTQLQQDLLMPLANNNRVYDVAQLDITFDMLPGYDTVYFDVVFGSEEYEEYVNSPYIDAFGLFVNGQNIALVNDLPVNINHPEMVFANGTELDGVLEHDGSYVVTFSAFVGEGTTGNTLTFIVGDASDTILDTTVYLSSLGAQDPDPISVDVVASDPNVIVDNLTGLVQNVAPGQTASFDIEFTGTGSVESFDLQFVNSDTGVLLGTIPVTYNNSYFYLAQAVDPDGDTLTYSLAEAPDGATIDADTGEIHWATDVAGEYLFVVEVSDGRGGYDEQAYVLTVDQDTSNIAPEIESNPQTLTAEIGRAYSYQVQASDADGNALKYYLTEAPEGMSIDTQTGQLTWTPTANQGGSDFSVEILVQDGKGGEATQDFVLSVPSYSSYIQVNQQPEITTTPSDSAYIGVPYIYDIDAIDPDGDLLRYELLNGPAGVSLNPMTGQLAWLPESGDVSENSYYTAIDPDTGFAFNVPVTGVGTHYLSVAVIDASGGVDVQTWTVEVEDDNQDPAILMDDTLHVGSGYLLEYQVQATDPNGDYLIFKIDQESIAKGVTIQPDSGLIQWLPSSENIGSHSVTVYASDGRGGTASRIFEINVTENAPAQIQSTPIYYVTLGDTYTYDVVLTDADGDVQDISLSLDRDSAARGMSFNGTTLQWTPNQVGAYEVSITAVDDAGAGQIQTYTINVIPQTVVSTPPEFTSTPTGPAVEQQLYEYVLAATDADAGDTVTFSLEDGPSGMAVTYDSGQDQWVLSWTPGAGSEGDYDVAVTATDSSGTSTTQSFTLPVVPQPTSGDAPVISSLPNQSIRLNNVYSYQVDATDPNSLGLTYTLESGPVGATLSATGALAWTPQAIGTYNIAIRVENTNGDYTTQTFSLNVLPSVSTNTPPEITSTPTSPATVNNAYQYQVVATDSEGDDLTYSLDAASLSRGMAIDSDTGLITWTPTSAGSGSVNVIVSVSDGEAAVTQTYTLPILSNTPPSITSTPVQQVALGDTYAYTITYTDSNPEQTITLSLDNPLSGMSIENVSGDMILTWDPQASGIAAGVYTVTLQAEDGAGGIATQEFTIQVYDPAQNTAPEILSSPRDEVGIGQQFIYQIVAADAEGDDLTYELTGTVPTGMTISSEGVVRWTPTDAQAQSGSQTHSWGIRVTDAREAYTEVNYSTTVVSQQTNAAPQITSVPTLVAAANITWTYTPTATDQDGDAVFWQLNPGQSRPTGMIFDSQTGRITWKATPSQVGETTIVLRATDSMGAYSDQTFTLQVVGANRGPLVTSNPVTNATTGQSYGYQVHAVDPDGDGITYSLTSYPDGMVIDETTGLVTWTAPTSVPVDPVEVVVRVTDSKGAATEQSWTIVVESDTVNQAPKITSTPDSYFPLVGVEYQYQVLATDANGNQLTYSLLTSPTGMSIDPNTGLITWTPGSTTSERVRVQVSDGTASVSQSFMLFPVSNNAPTIDPMDDLDVSAGSTLRHRITASDPDSDYLTFELVSGPEGLTIDQYGQMVWETTSALAGSTFEVQVKVTDIYGQSDTTSFDVNVIADVQAPEVYLISSTTNPAIGTEVIFLIQASDDVAISELSLIIGSQAVAVNEQGYARFTLQNAGDYTVTATAYDEAGNESSDQITLTAYDPNDAAPVVTITVPQDDAILTSPTDVLVTVDDDTLTSYTLYLVDDQGNIISELASGTQEVTNAPIGRVDTTAVANGAYTLRLVAEDAGGNVSVDNQFITIESNAKIGNFSLGFTDLSTSLGGLPISISRTYDTLNSQEVGDFGYGWTLDLFDMDIRTDVDMGTSDLSDIGLIPSLQHGSRLHVTLPDGTKQSFTMQVVPINSSAAAGLLGFVLSMYRVEFVADPGNTSTLTTTNPNIQVFMNDYGELETGGGVPYNPASPYLDLDYIMTTQDGTEFRLNGDTGQLDAITDRQGNRLDISDSGIRTVTPDGQTAAEIAFTRDQLGRITQITDTAGATINYTYDSNGDLISVTDRVGSTTTFIYDPNEAAGYEHYLTSIVDARGVSVMNLNFDETTGRIISLADASGAAIPFNYDLNPPQLPAGYTREVLADADDVPTEIIRDSRGNTVRQLQRLSDNGTTNDTTDDVWSITVYEYDANDYRTRTSETFQATGDAAYTAAPTNWLSTADYDAFGQVLSTTDALGNTTYFTYDRYGNLLTTTDAQGNTTRNTYNQNGLLTATTDALGNVTSYAYDNHGNMTAVTDSNGNVVSTFVYDGKNQLLATTDINGNSRYFTYDASGNQTHSWSYQDGFTTVSVTAYDAAQRVTASSSYTLTGEFTGSDADRAALLVAIAGATATSTSSTTYTQTGQVLETEDMFGNVSQSMYDVRGNLVQSRSRAYREAAPGSQPTPIWSVTRTFYDENGRSIASTSPFFTDDSGNLLTDLNDTDELRVSYSIYDALGRVTQTQYLKGVTIDIAADPQNAGLYVTTLGFDPESITTDQIQSTSTTEYDAAGRVAKSTSTTGTVTTYEYDEVGRQIRTTLDIDGDPLTTNDIQETSVEYDSLGRQTLTRDALGNETRYTYDDLGRLIQTTYADDTTTSTEYDNLGRRISETDQLGRTTQYECDDAGRLTAVVLPEVIDPDTDLATNPRYEYGYDAQGRQTSITDPNNHVTVFTYDHLGRQTSRKLPLDTLTGIESSHYDDRTLTELSASGDDITASTALGQTAFMVDFEGNVTAYLYDNSALGGGRTTSVSYYSAADLSGVTITVGMSPQLLRAALAGITAARTVTYTYDDEGRMTSMDDSTFAVATSYTYDDQGRTVQIINDQGIINYAYNDLGQKVRTWTSTDATGNDAITDTRYTYDTLGRLSTVEVFERFNAYTPGSETNSAEEVTTYHYDAVGNLDYTVMEDLDGTNVITDYTYDTLNRLDEMVQFEDRNSNDVYDAGTDEMLASYDYTLDLAGNRVAATETIDGYTYQWTWTYDALNRLTEEVLDASDNSLDYTDTFTYDLAGNRVESTHDQGSDSSVETTTTYSYDANDRLEWQFVDHATDDTQDRYTEFGYNNTTQTSKTVYQGTDNTGQIVSSTSYVYNEMGRMSQVTEETYTGGSLTQTKVTDYEYNTKGLRVTETISIDGVETTAKSYLFDTMNPTGYVQVLEEYINDVIAYSYTLGHDVISVAKAVGIPANGSGDTAATVYHLLTDGHGSTRLLANLTATTVALAQQYLYNAYGEMLEASHLATATTALTSLLYSGEWTNPNGTQYLRARFYDPATGSFNRLDPFAGNQNDPQSLHKYLYTHGNPIMGIDPSGNMTLLELASTAWTVTKIIGITVLSATAVTIGTSPYFAFYDFAFDHSRSVNPDNVSTRNKELALLSAAVYESDNMVGNIAGWSSLGIAQLESYSRTSTFTGFAGEVYYNSVQNMFVMAFRGTENSIQDIITDMLQAVTGMSLQYNNAVKYGKQLVESVGVDNVMFTGHSLGGGLASAAAVATGAPAVTFNAAGLSHLRGREYSPSVTAYYVENEILNGIQNTTWLPDAYGDRYYIRPAASDVLLSSIDRHRMPTMLRALGL